MRSWPDSATWFARRGLAPALALPSPEVQARTETQRRVGLDLGQLSEKGLAAWLRKLDREEPDYRS